MAPSIRSKAEKPSNEDMVIGTNNSSIVSKRSVERVYYPEPHFFRYFVRKPQRRSPLINRGYWLRMHAVHHVVQRFLQQTSPKPKVIINLGCGYLSDPLPFQWLSKESTVHQDAIFIDVDYPQLISKKVDVIQSQSPLHDLLGHFETKDLPEGVFLRSHSFLAVGCDLTDVTRLERIFASCLDLRSCMVLCAAEVAVTYMSVEAADALIGWVANHDDVRLCLLEQFLPAGPDHPFAKTMMKHFEKLHTPLRSILQYPTLADQVQRFKDCGWPTVIAQSLWDFWCDDSKVAPQQRLQIDRAEPFDEWEEFVLFCSHYMIVESTNAESGESYVPADRIPLDSRLQSIPLSDRSHAMYKLRDSEGSYRFPRRRFGALYGSGTNMAYFGGISERSRVNVTDLYRVAEDASSTHDEHSEMPKSLILPPTVPARACHAVASSKKGQYLLSGGRASPDLPMQDCWYFDGQSWAPVQDLPTPLFRHAMTWVDFQDSDPGVLVYGGKTFDRDISRRWLLWRPSIGWTDAQIIGQCADPVFGAVLCSTANGEGLLVGGLTSDGVIQYKLWQWDLECQAQQVVITLSECTFDTDKSRTLLPRFGAQLVLAEPGPLLIGGVGNRVQTPEPEVLVIRPPSKPLSTVSATQLPYILHESPPLLTGHSALNVNDAILIVGGGGTCFSFGTFWNTVPFCLTPQATNDRAKYLCHRQNLTTEGPGAPLLQNLAMSDTHGKNDPEISSKRTETWTDAGTDDSHSHPGLAATSQTEVTAHDFSADPAPSFTDIVQKRIPGLLRGLDIGPCRDLWSLQYLSNRIGPSRKVSVHVATTRHMDFLRKSFAYVTKPFATFADEIAAGSRQYLRSMAAEQPTRKPSNIANDFPEIAADFSVPPSLSLVSQNLHSSVLRISGPVNMWLHYDVMANILCQIKGTKRILLYPPTDVLHFALPPGKSSSSVDVFAPNAQELHPPLSSAHPHSVTLRPGETLYIPPLWLHSVSPEDEISISANVFFRDLSSGYVPGKDVYGNRDILAYEKGREDVEKLAASFQGVPRDMARFYLGRLAHELLDKARDS